MPYIEHKQLPENGVGHFIDSRKDQLTLGRPDERLLVASDDDEEIGIVQIAQRQRRQRLPERQNEGGVVAGRLD